MSPDIKKFQKQVLEHFRKQGRDLPWRHNTNPYRIWVSEIMLQQTQVPRVIEKYETFLKAFPSVNKLAQAPLKKVLGMWQGLGYNRRALAMSKTAKIVATEFRGRLPRIVDELVTLPGIGHATACAILTYAHNQPCVFIETNIRSVYLYHFFRTRKNVNDQELLPLIEKTLDQKNPRIWYWALMDYGSWLKKEVTNLNKKSKHYVRQSRFKGSHRQVRGAVLKMLALSSATIDSIRQKTNFPLTRIKKTLAELRQEGFVKHRGKKYYIA